MVLSGFECFVMKVPVSRVLKVPTISQYVRMTFTEHSSAEEAVEC